MTLACGNARDACPILQGLCDPIYQGIQAFSGKRRKVALSLVSLCHDDDVALLRIHWEFGVPRFQQDHSQIGALCPLFGPLNAQRLHHILRYARRTRLQSLAVLEDGQAEILEILAPPRSRVVDVPVKRLSVPRGALLTAILKDDGVTIPGGDTVIHAGDTVVVLTTQTARNAVMRLFKERAL